MDERIEFNDNPNGKLNCQFFPLIRLHNQIKNAVGSQKQIYLKGVYKGNAKILTSRSVKLADGVLDAKYRRGEEHPEYMEPGQVYEVNLRTTKISNTFLPGHRLRLTVTSSARHSPSKVGRSLLWWGISATASTREGVRRNEIRSISAAVTFSPTR